MARPSAGMATDSQTLLSEDSAADSSTDHVRSQAVPRQRIFIRVGGSFVVLAAIIGVAIVAMRQPRQLRGAPHGAGLSEIVAVDAETEPAPEAIASLADFVAGFAECVKNTTEAEAQDAARAIQSASSGAMLAEPVAVLHDFYAKASQLEKGQMDVEIYQVLLKRARQLLCSRTTPRFRDDLLRVMNKTMEGKNKSFARLHAINKTIVLAGEDVAKIPAPRKEGLLFAVKKFYAEAAPECKDQLDEQIYVALVKEFRQAFSDALLNKTFAQIRAFNDTVCSKNGPAEGTGEEVVALHEFYMVSRAADRAIMDASMHSTLRAAFAKAFGQATKGKNFQQMRAAQAAVESVAAPAAGEAQEIIDLQSFYQQASADDQTGISANLNNVLLVAFGQQFFEGFSEFQASRAATTDPKVDKALLATFGKVLSKAAEDKALVKEFRQDMFDQLSYSGAAEGEEEEKENESGSEQEEQKDNESGSEQDTGDSQ